MKTLAKLATLAVVLAVIVGMAATTPFCARSRPRRCAACARRIGGRQRPEEGLR